MEKIKEIICKWLEEKFLNNKESKNSSFVIFQINNNCNNDNRNMNDEINEEIKIIKEKLDSNKYKSFGKTMIIKDGEIIGEYDF